MENKIIDIPAAEAEQTTPAAAEQPKEPKKEFFVIRGAKAIGRGVGAAVGAVGNFVTKHPKLSTGIGIGIGWVARMAYVSLTGGSDDEAVPEEAPELLPEPEEAEEIEIEDSEDDSPIDLDE